MNFCTKCGHQRIYGAAFCTNCGNEFAKSQQGIPPPPPPRNYIDYYQQSIYQSPPPNHTNQYKKSVYPAKPAEFPGESQNIEKPKLSLYDKIYRTFGGMLFLALAGVGLLIPSIIFICTFIEDTLLLLLLLFLSMVIIAMCIVTPIIVVHSRLNRSPVLKERVVLRNKEQIVTWLPLRHAGRAPAVGQSLTFNFTDGSQKIMLLRGIHMGANGMFDLSVAGDSGSLIYQELNGKTRLIDFENDNVNIKRSKNGIYDKIYNTQNGRVALVISLSLSPGLFLIAFMYAFFPLIEKHPVFNLLPIILCVVIPLGIYFVPRFVVYIKLKNPSKKHLQVKEKKERVKLLDKGQFGKHANDITRRVLVFEMPDKSRKCFQVRSNDIYNCVIVNDTGILTYKERKSENMLINFEIDKLKGFL